MATRFDRHVVITIYSHPEFYPPTLNMILELSRNYDHVFVLCRNVLISNWEYPDNVTIKACGDNISIRESEQQVIWRKIIAFLDYLFKFIIILVDRKPKLLVLVDPIATLSFRIIQPFINNNLKVWYHNHDVLEIDKVRKYSIAWFAWFFENAIFKRIDIFTLPTLERLKYFPMDKLNGEFYLLPNYPQQSFFSKFERARSSNTLIRLIFQGEISEGHGIEEIIAILKNRVNTKKLELVLLGRISLIYKQKLLDLATKFDCLDSLFFKDRVPYKFLPGISSNCHFGVGIYSGEDVMNRTIASASNKIYEYIAVGLPVLILYNEKMAGLYSKSWALPTDLTPGNLVYQLGFADSNYCSISAAAIEDSILEFNFQLFFDKIKF
jgi:hypothetical protein